MRSTEDLLRRIISEAVHIDDLLEAQDPTGESPEERRRRLAREIAADRPEILAAARAAVVPTAGAGDAPEVTRRQRAARIERKGIESTGLSPTVGGQRYAHLAEVDDLTRARQVYASLRAELTQTHQSSIASAYAQLNGDDMFVPKRVVTDIILTADVKDEIKRHYDDATLESAKRGAVQAGYVNRETALKLFRVIKNQCVEVARRTSASDRQNAADRGAEKIVSMLEETDKGREVLRVINGIVAGSLPDNGQQLNSRSLIRLRLSTHGAIVEDIVKKMDGALREIKRVQAERGVTERGFERIEGVGGTTIRMPSSILPEKREARSLSDLTDEEREDLDTMPVALFEHERAKGLYLVACAATILSEREEIEDNLADNQKTLSRVKRVLDFLQEALSGHRYADLAITDSVMGAYYEQTSKEREDESQARIALSGVEVEAAKHLAGRVTSNDAVEALNRLVDPKRGGVTRRQLDAIVDSIEGFLTFKFSKPPTGKEKKAVEQLESTITDTMKKNSDASFFRVDLPQGAGSPEPGSAEVLGKGDDIDVSLLSRENSILEQALDVAISLSPSPENLQEFEQKLKAAGDFGGVVPTGSFPGDPRVAFQKVTLETLKENSVGKHIAKALGFNLDSPEPIRTFLRDAHSDLADIADEASQARKEAYRTGYEVKKELSGEAATEENRAALGAVFRAGSSEIASQAAPDLQKELGRRIDDAQNDSNELSPEKIFLSPSNLLRGAAQLALDMNKKYNFSASPYAFPFGTISGSPRVDLKNVKNRKEYREKLELTLERSESYYRALGGSIAIGAEVVVPSMMNTQEGALSLGVCRVVDINHMTYSFTKSDIDKIAGRDSELADALRSNNATGKLINVIGVTITCPLGSWRVGNNIKYAEDIQEKSYDILINQLRLALSRLDRRTFGAAVGIDSKTGELTLRGVAPAFLTARVSQWYDRLNKNSWPNSFANVAAAEMTHEQAMQLRAEVERGGTRMYVPASAVQLSARDLLHPSSPFNINRPDPVTYFVPGDRPVSVTGLREGIKTSEKGIEGIAEDHRDTLEDALRPVSPEIRVVVNKVVGLPVISVVVGASVRQKLPDVHAAIERYEQLKEDFEPAGESVDSFGTTRISYSLKPALGDPTKRIESFTGLGGTISVGDTVFIDPMYPGRKMMIAAAESGTAFPPELYGVGKVSRIYMGSGDGEIKLPPGGGVSSGNAVDFNIKTLLVDLTFRGDQVKRQGKRGSLFSPPVELPGVGAAFVRKINAPSYDPSLPLKTNLKENYRLLDGTTLQSSLWDNPPAADVRRIKEGARSTPQDAAVGAIFRVTDAGPYPGEVGRLAGFVTRSEVPSGISESMELQDVNAILDASGATVLAEINDRIRELRRTIVGVHAQPVDVRHLFRSIDRDVSRRYEASTGTPEDKLPATIPVPKSVRDSLGTFYGCSAILSALMTYGPERDTPSHVSIEAERRRLSPDEVTDTYVRNDRTMSAPYDHGAHTLEAKYVGDSTGIRPASWIGTTFRLKIEGEEGLAYTRLLMQEMEVVQGKIDAAVSDIESIIKSPRMARSERALSTARSSLEGLKRIQAEVARAIESVRSLGHVSGDSLVNTLHAWDEKTKSIDRLQTKRDVSFEALDKVDSSWKTRLRAMHDSVLSSHNHILGKAPIPTSGRVEITDDGVIRVILSSPRPVDDPIARQLWQSTQSSIIARIGEIVRLSTLRTVKLRDGSYGVEVGSGPVESETKGAGFKVLLDGIKSRFYAHKQFRKTLPWEADVLAHPPLGEVISSEEVREAIRRDEDPREGTAPGLRSDSGKMLLASEHSELGNVKIELDEAMRAAIFGAEKEIVKKEDKIIGYVQTMQEWVSGDLSSTIDPLLHFFDPESIRSKSVKRVKLADDLGLTDPIPDPDEKETTPDYYSIASIPMQSDQKAILMKVAERIKSYKNKFLSDVRRGALSTRTTSTPDAAARAAADIAYGLDIALGNVLHLAERGSLSVREADNVVKRSRSDNEMRTDAEEISMLRRQQNEMQSERDQLRAIKTFPSESRISSLVSGLDAIEKSTRADESRLLCVPIPQIMEPGLGTLALLDLKQGSPIPERILPAVLQLLEPVGVSRPSRTSPV